jgi:hypothetical protein
MCVGCRNGKTFSASRGRTLPVVGYQMGIANSFARTGKMPSCGLIPANGFNFTKLFAFFLPRDTVFFRSLSATIFQVKNSGQVNGWLLR